MPVMMQHLIIPIRFVTAQGSCIVRLPMNTQDSSRCVPHLNRVRTRCKACLVIQCQMCHAALQTLSGRDVGAPARAMLFIILFCCSHLAVPVMIQHMIIPIHFVTAQDSQKHTAQDSYRTLLPMNTQAAVDEQNIILIKHILDQRTTAEEW